MNCLSTPFIPMAVSVAPLPTLATTALTSVNGADAFWFGQCSLQPPAE
jgi:hypothetical protein